MDAQVEPSTKESSSSFHWTQNSVRVASLGPWVIFLVGVIMCWISWGKWMDILVDFSLQVYAPWQLSQGQVLYKDIVYIYGPLSAYIHSFLFRMFGPGISTLAWFNIGLIALMTAIIHRLFRELFNPLTGFLTALSFVAVFAFGNYLQVSNYNFVCAYEYTLTHGIFLSFVGIHQFVEYLRNLRSRTLFWIGLLSGLILLTKPEVFLAEITAIGAGLLLALRFEDTSFKSNLHKFFIFLSAFCIPSLLFIVYFSFYMPIEQALASPFNHLTYIFNSQIKALPFFKAVTGTGEYLWDNVRNLFIILGGYLFIYAILTFLNKTVSNRYGNPRAFYWVFFSGLLALVIIFKRNIFWMDLMRPLPLILIVYLGILVHRLFFRSETFWDRKRVISIFVLTVFSLVLLFKIFFKVHVQHYGFALALPGFLIFSAILIHELPGVFKRIQGSALAPSAFGLAFVLSHAGMMAWISFNMYQMKDFPVGSGRDRMYDFAPHRMGTPAKPYVRGILFNYALEWIDQELGPEEEFVTLPADTMLNYLSRRRSPIVTGLYNPGALLLTGESLVLDSLQEKSPNYIVLVDQEFPHYNARFFGRDYFQSTYQWIAKNYQVVQQNGSQPFTGQGFGLQILKKRND